MTTQRAIHTGVGVVVTGVSVIAVLLAAAFIASSPLLAACVAAMASIGVHPHDH